MTKALRFRASTFAVVVVAMSSVSKVVSERGSGACVQLSGGEWSGDMEALALGCSGDSSQGREHSNGSF